MNESFESQMNQSVFSNTTRLYREVMLKIIVLGDYGVGKTAVIRRYTEGKFSSNYKMTIGAEFSLKCCVWDNFTQINIQLWDIAGHERFGYMTRVYYRYASAAAIVFDVSRGQTFQSLEKWLADVKEKVITEDGRPLPVVILANKSDIHGSIIPSDDLDKLCRNHEILDWFPTSAKENVNIEEAMSKLIASAMGKRPKMRLGSDNDSINLSTSGLLTTKEERYCCL